MGHMFLVNLSWTTNIRKASACILFIYVFKMNDNDTWMITSTEDRKREMLGGNTQAIL